MNKDRELEIDAEFNIETCEFDNEREDANHRAYEPTPYDVLDELIESGLITGDDVVVDMGCGKGRVGFYLSNKTGCSVTGIDYDEIILEKARENYTRTLRKCHVEFINAAAENYEIRNTDSVFYFFNPFSEKILSSVLANIRDSYYECEREIKLVFYYPTLEYVGKLMTCDGLDFIDEIDCSHLYKDTKGRECIMIFAFGT